MSRRSEVLEGIPEAQDSKRVDILSEIMGAGLSAVDANAVTQFDIQYLYFSVQSLHLINGYVRGMWN